MTHLLVQDPVSTDRPLLIELHLSTGDVVKAAVNPTQIVSSFHEVVSTQVGLDSISPQFGLCYRSDGPSSHRE